MGPGVVSDGTQVVSFRIKVRTMKLEIQAIGNPEFSRFIITNDQGEVFDGSGWNNDRSQAALFNQSQAVAVQYNALQDQMYEGCPLREFTVPLNIRVRSAAPFTQKQLEEYLEQVTSIFLDHEKGTGPVEDSMVQLGVTWAGLKEKADSKEMEKR
jgi:hypothetical protein